MADRFAENGAIQYALANPEAGSKRAGLAGYVMGALEDWLKNPVPPLSRLSAPGRLRGKFFDSGIAPLAMDFANQQFYSNQNGVMEARSFSDIVTFSRTTNATVTRADGTIGYAPHNLLTFSEQFDNSYWVKNHCTISSNITAAPNGTITADKILDTTNNALHGVYSAVSGAIIGNTYTYSVYAKASELNSLGLFPGFSSASGFVTFNLTNGTVSSGTGTITSIGNGWYRCSTNFVALATTLYIFITTGNTYAGVGNQGIFICGAQLELGSTATAYNHTTVKNLLGFSEAFDNAAWTKSNSFVQTNLLTFSEDFSNVRWVKYQSSISSNIALAPNGYQTADKLVENTTTDRHQINSGVVSGANTFSIYAKAAERSILGVYSGAWFSFNLSTGIATGTGATITPVGDGWYRCVCPKTNGVNPVYIGPSINTVIDDASWSYAGDGTSGIYIWGAQLVQGSVAGDYRRTDAAALPIFYPNHNGVVCAQQIQSTAGNGTVLESYTASGVSMTFSIWMRRITGTGNVDITMDTGTTWTTQAITTSWARYSITSTPASGARTAGIRLVTSGDIIQVFGAQVSDSASLDPYVLNAGAAPSAAAYYGARFDYDPVTLAPKGLLIEEQRVNLLTFSEDFRNTADAGATRPWVYSQTTITPDNAVSPDGTLDADRLNPDTSPTEHGIYASMTISNHVLSVYAKANTLSNLYFRIRQSTGQALSVNFDLSAGTVSKTTNQGTYFTTGVGSIQPVGNGWYRCSVYVVCPSFTSNVFISLSDTNNPTFTTNGEYVYTGIPTNNLYIWGAQLEAGAFATSYIPTAASQVTRTADVATIQGSNFWSWWNRLEGSLVAQFYSPASGNRNIVGVDDNTANNRYQLRTEGTDPYFRQRWNNTEQVAFDLGTYTANSLAKIGYGYKVDDFSGVFNNGTVQTDTSGSTVLVDRMRLGTSQAAEYLNGHIRTLTYYPIELSPTVLRGLTT